jgi:hypothetical protein
MPDYTRVTIKWHGDKIRGKLRTELRKRVSKCAGLVKREAIGLVGTSGTTQRTGQTKRRRGGVLKVYRKRSKRLNAAVSAPGEPPRMQTGRLKRSVKVKIMKGIRGRVYSRDPKAHLLEFGTVKMAARPWLNVALANMRAAIQSVLAERMNLG